MKSTNLFWRQIMLHEADDVISCIFEAAERLAGRGAQSGQTSRGGGHVVAQLLRRGHAVAQLVEALRYKPEGRGFHSRWFHRNVSLT